LIGKIFGNRYRLIELIGEGGMALVYKAECSLLCRTVAVKVLRPQYASDAEFVERFRREARAAASLSHPNVVNIYDVGQEDGIDYIVMEYIPGDTLKNIIKKEAPFTVKRALDYTRQIAEALNHAHQRNIIHRDIKPHNILVTPDGQIKVADFGIARAISASSFTQTGIVVGSVQYASPEQIKGGIVGPQSDLYSLGCVFYELLTGAIPFKGDTSISIALQHLQNKIQPIRELRPDIPSSVEAILNKAMAKDVAERYPSAFAMLNDILNAQSRLSYETKINDDEMPTQVWRTMNTDESKPKWYQTWFVKLLMGLGIIASVIVIMSYILLRVIVPDTEIVVPDLVGKDITEARQILKQKKLLLKVVNEVYHNEYPINVIIAQKPISGNKKKPNTEVNVVVSKGPRLVRVPNLMGKTEAEARIILADSHLKLGEVLNSFNPDYPDGLVFKQLPEPNTQIEQGAKVSITINSGQDDNLVIIPNFIGRSLSEVRAELVSLGLIFNQATPMPSNIYAEGIVIDQQPTPNEKVPVGTAMNFIVSSGFE
jgi:serine/threonine protein kinase